MGGYCKAAKIRDASGLGHVRFYAIQNRHEKNEQNRDDDQNREYLHQSEGRGDSMTITSGMPIIDAIAEADGIHAWVKAIQPL